jgi:hypothetical protein
MSDRINCQSANRTWSLIAERPLWDDQLEFYWFKGVAVSADLLSFCMAAEYFNCYFSQSEKHRVQQAQTQLEQRLDDPQAAVTVVAKQRDQAVVVNTKELDLDLSLSTDILPFWYVNQLLRECHPTSVKESLQWLI